MKISGWLDEKEAGNFLLDACPCLSQSVLVAITAESSTVNKCALQGMDVPLRQEKMKKRGSDPNNYDATR